MKSPLTSSTYLSRQSFELEKEFLFKKYWIFVGPKHFFQDPHSFVVREIADTSVVIQNLDGELLAFENSCPHRQMPLQWESIGKRALVCRFHGWSFNNDGCPKAIPHHNELYCYDSEILADLRLKTFPTAVVGNLVFVNLADDPLPIEEQFGSELLECFREFSLHYDNEILRTTMRIQANWKLCVEIIQDPNHVEFVHSKTLSKKVRALDVKERSGKITPHFEHEQFFQEQLTPISSLSWMGTEPIIQLQEYEWYKNVDRYGNDDVYYDAMLFPNTHLISSTGGHSFSIESYFPISEHETEVEILIMLARKVKYFPYTPVVLLEHARQGQVIFAEDIEAAERVHAGLLQSNRLTEFGIYELHNYKFRSWFSRLYAVNAGERNNVKEIVHHRAR